MPELTNQTELELLRRIQEHTQPRSVPAVKGYSVFAKTVPATWGNGDFFDIIGVTPRGDRPGYVLDESPEVDHLVLSLGDATGHGLAAALMATAFTSMLRVSIRLGVYHRELLAALNAQLYRDFPSDHFVTLLLGRLDRDRSMFRWVSFGQAPVWIHRAATGKAETLEPHHPPLGVMPETFHYQPTETVLEPGDTLLAISDGFHETLDAEGEPVGEAALLEEFRVVAARPPQEVLDSLWQRLCRHAGAGLQADDRTFLLIRRDA